MDNFAIVNFNFGYLLPSWHEINMSLVTAILILLLLTLLQHLFKNENNSTSFESKSRHLKDVLKEKSSENKQSLIRTKSRQPQRHESKVQEFSSEDGSRPSTPREGSSSFFQIKIELVSAKNLPAASMSGTSDPYAVITCNSQKRFSSVVPGSRNPMWYEEFVFYVDELPAIIVIAIYDWDIIWKSAKLGSTTVKIDEEGKSEPNWFGLDGNKGQICLRLDTKQIKKVDGHAFSTENGQVILSGGRTRRSSTGTETVQVATEVRQKPGPLQTIFDLPPDELLLHSFSCALERSFLYHGRMYVSSWNVCFHSNVFSKQLKIILPYEDIEEIRKSLHAFINPSITIVLKAGSGGHGVPPLASPDGKVKYKFASFWNRGYTLRILQKTWTSFLAMEEKNDQEENQSSMDNYDMEGLEDEFHEDEILSPSPSASSPSPSRLPSPSLSPSTPKPSPPLKDSILIKEILSPIATAELPCASNEYFTYFYDDDSMFTQKYRNARKDTEIQMEKWHESENYRGLIRKLTFRSVCTSPMCPSTTAMSEWQHVLFSTNHESLIIEAITQAHDVPFGSYFEVQSQWNVKTLSSSSCVVTLSIGVHFKKWCVMQGKIKTGVANECKADATLTLDLAKKEIEEMRANAESNFQSHNPLSKLEVLKTQTLNSEREGVLSLAC